MRSRTGGSVHQREDPRLPHWQMIALPVPCIELDLATWYRTKSGRPIELSTQQNNPGQRMLVFAGKMGPAYPRYALRRDIKEASNQLQV